MNLMFLVIAIMFCCGVLAVIAGAVYKNIPATIIFVGLMVLAGIIHMEMNGKVLIE